MFGWLRKSSKEPTNSNEAQSHPPNIQAPIAHANYVHVDDKITPKSLDTQNLDDEDIDNTEFADRPHSVTAARPFFQAQQHLEQQQMKQEVIQSNYMSDNEDNYNDDDEEEEDPNLHLPDSNEKYLNDNDNNDDDDDKKKKKKWGLFKNKKDKENDPSQQENDDNPQPHQLYDQSSESSKTKIRSFQPKQEIIAPQSNSNIPNASRTDKPRHSYYNASSANKFNRKPSHPHDNDNNNNKYLAMAPEFEEQMKNNPYFEPVIDVNQFSNDSKNIIDTKNKQKRISRQSNKKETSPSVEDVEKRQSNRSQSLALDSNNPKFIASITNNKQAADTMMTSNIIHGSSSRQQSQRRQFNLDSVSKSKVVTSTQKRKRTISTEKKANTRGFAKRSSVTKGSVNNNSSTSTSTSTPKRRRSSSSKKNRTFTPQSVAKLNMNNNSNKLPPKLMENESVITPIQEQQGRDKFNGVFVIRIEEWLKLNNLWFNEEKGNKLLICLLEAGIENPDDDLSILSAYPDLHEIAAMANLNILQRRKFINAAHAKINQFDQPRMDQQEISEEKQNGDRDNNKEKRMQFRKREENKKVVVMSAEEQEALARMDSIIEQLQTTRNLIKKRILFINRGGLSYENIIRSEFKLLKNLLSQREEELIDDMKYKIKNKIEKLNNLDYDLLYTLQQCQKSKIDAQKLMKTNEQPRVSRQKWRVLMGRKKKVINLIDDVITNEIINNDKNKEISTLIITSMGMNDIMPTLPQPLIAQHLSSNFEQKKQHNIASLYQFPHHHKRHYDTLNPYLLNIFTKNQAQLHLQMSVPGFAFNYTQRAQMHKLLTEYGMISDVEEQLKEQLKALFPRQFDGMTDTDIVNEVKEDNNYYHKTKQNAFSKSINLKDPSNKTLIIGRNKKKKGASTSALLNKASSPSPSPSQQPGATGAGTGSDINPELGPLPVGKSDAILPHNILFAKMILINPEDYDKQIQKYLPKTKSNKKSKKSKTQQTQANIKPNISESKAQKDSEWKPYATLSINVELDENECNEWELIEKRLKYLEEQTLKKDKKINKYNDNIFNQIDDNNIEEKENFKIRKFFANIIDKSENVVKTKRIKEIEIQIGMQRKTKQEQIDYEQGQKKKNAEEEKNEMEMSPSPNAYDRMKDDNEPMDNPQNKYDHTTLELEQDEREIGWISLGWIDIQSLAVKASENEKAKEEEKKEKDLNDEEEQIPEQYKTEFEDDAKNKEQEQKPNVRSLKIPFLLEKQFQELMTQTYLASLELEMMLNDDEQINRDKMEKLIIEQLANDELFEFNSRNVDEFEKNFNIVIRTRCRDRIHVEMTGMNYPMIPPEIYNKHKEITLPLESDNNNNKSKDKKTMIKQQEFDINNDDELKDDEKVNENNGNNNNMDQLKECNLIVFQSSFTSRTNINFSLLRPVVMVLKERKLDSNFVNGFISIIGNESIQFIDPITSSSSILSRNLPQDCDSCGLIIDFIRFKHPALTSGGTISNNNNDNGNNDDEEEMTSDELLTSKLRNASKKLSIIRIGGSYYSSDLNERKLTGRLDIYNIFTDSWIMAGELSPSRENMACTMFYGRVCVTGGNISSSSFEPTSLCEEFSFTERKWKPLKNMNIARFGHCICQFDEKPTKLFVYGGEITNGDWTNSVEIYDPQKRGWFIKKESFYTRYGSSCCVWTIDNTKYIIVISGQDENDESSKHCELYNINKNEWIKLKDLNYEHGIFPAIWCDSDDNCIYIASQFIIIDQKNKQNSIIKYRVEMLDHPNNKWRIIKSQNKIGDIFKTTNCYQILKSSANWNANAIRKSVGASVKIST